MATSNKAKKPGWRAARSGCPVDLGVVVEDTDLELYQVGSVGGAQALEMQDGRVCYSFEVCVVNQRSTPECALAILSYG